MLRYWANVLLFDGEQPFFLMSGPSFQYRRSASYSVEELCYLRQLIPCSGFFSFWGSCATCDSLLYSCSPRCRVRDNQKYQFENQIDNDGSLLRVSRTSRIAFSAMGNWTGFRLLRSLGAAQRCSRQTAAAVPSYLVRRLGVPVVEFVQWSFTLTWSSRSLVNRLYGSNASVVSLCRWALNALLLCFFLCNGAPAQSIAGSNAMMYYLFLVDSFSCYRLWAFRVSRRLVSIDRIN